MTSRSPETLPMITVACPWCDAPAEVSASGVHCPDCRVTVALAEEPEVLALAA